MYASKKIFKFIAIWLIQHHYHLIIDTFISVVGNKMLHSSMQSCFKSNASAQSTIS